MANQSLYRRYRPRRFSELKGQDHIVRALRNSVAEGREGQAYLFSGPRGTGKTTSARILAKVLNCENVTGGEPCCECTSCRSVEQGTSYDVHELDAASNNGVDAMRDLIEKASLGTPGRHKVYILDEVHMLSKGAEAALLKTLEEPPPHVVFVLATTDPQKMSDTIRSRTQHLQFHLVAADTLHDHVRWVAEEAGLTVTDEAVDQVIAEGAGSPRDTLTALELVVNTGGAATETLAVDEFVEAMIDEDPGRALTMVAQAIARGRDPRTVTEELIGFMRNGFLSMMAPDLVQLPSHRLEALTDLSRRCGAAGLVRGIEHLGAALTEMRQAPDPRVLLDVATVQLTSPHAAGDLAGLTARLAKLEKRIADGVGPAAAPGASSVAGPPVAPADAVAGGAPPAPVDPATGRRKLGSRVAATAATGVAGAVVAATSPSAADQPADSPSSSTAASTRSAAASAPTSDEPARSDDAPSSATDHGPETDPPFTQPADPAPAGDVAPTSGGQPSADDWATVRANFTGMARARLAPAEFVSSGPGALTIGLPNEPHRSKCEGMLGDVESAMAEHMGSPVTVEMVVSGGGPGGGSSDGGSGGGSSDGGSDRSPSGGSGRATGRDGTASASASMAGAPQSDGIDDVHPAGARSAPSATTSGSLARDVAPVAATSAVPCTAPDTDPDTALDTDPDPAVHPVPDPAADRAPETGPGAAPEATSHLSVVPDDAPSSGDAGTSQDETSPADRSADPPVLNGRAIADRARAQGPGPDPDAEFRAVPVDLPDDHEVDLDDLIDAPPETVKTPLDRLSEAFPGSELVDDAY